MNNKKILRILITMFLALNILVLFSLNVKAENNLAAPLEGGGTSSSDGFSFGEIIGSVQEFFKKGKEGSGDEEITKTFVDKTAPLFSTLYYVGVAISVGVLILLGIEYATAKPDKKAELKEKLIVFVVAVMILGGAIPIWSFVVRTFSGTTGIEV